MEKRDWDHTWNNTSKASYIYREYLLRHTREYPPDLHQYVKRDLNNYHVIETLPNGPYKSMLKAFGSAGGFEVLESSSPYPLLISGQAQQNGIYIQGMTKKMPSNIILAANSLEVTDSNSVLTNVSQTSYKDKNLDDSIVVAPEGKNIDYGSTGRAHFQEVGAMFIGAIVGLVVVILTIISHIVIRLMEAQNEQVAKSITTNEERLKSYENNILALNFQ